MNAISDDDVWIGEWRILASRNQISLEGKAVRLEPRTMAVLLCLADNPGRVVERARLEAAVWPRMVIGYDALSNTVAKLRKALGDDPRQPRFIETIPKVGYRLVADVRRSSSEAVAPDAGLTNDDQRGGPRDSDLPVRNHGTVRSRDSMRDRQTHLKWAAALAGMMVVVAAVLTTWLDRGSGEGPDAAERAKLAPATKPSVAVLPFTNLSDDPEEEYFSDGLTDDLITSLSGIGGLFVVSRESTFTYKGRSVPLQQIASDLGAQYVLEGSVRRAGNEVRINARLTDMGTGGYLWAGHYDGTLDNIFALQEDLARQITQSLSVTLTPAEQNLLATNETTSAAAYQAFLRGREHYKRQTPEDFTTARVYLEQAVTIDPDYNRAYAALAQLYWEAKDREWFPSLRTGYTRTRERIREYLEKARRKPTANALFVTARIRVAYGKFPAAIAAAERAVELAPSDADAYITLAETLIYAGRPEEALGYITNAMRLDPLHRGYPYYLRGLAAFGLERYDAAAESLAKALELNPKFRRPAAVLAAALSWLDRKQDASAALELYGSEYRGYGITDTVLVFPYRHEADRVRLAEGLRRAGMKEKSWDLP